MKRVLASAGAIVLMLHGCAALGPDLPRAKLKAYVGNRPDLDRADVKAFANDADAVLADFARLAGVTVPASNGEWRPVIDAGINYVDTRCDRFMDALFWLNRTRETTSRQIQFTGVAAGAALAIVEASKRAIGLTPLGFSLLDQTVNNFGAGLLYNLNPSTVSLLVEKKQQAYIQSLTPSYTSKAVALRVIQGYAAICLPPSIETEVERAIDAKEYRAQVISDGSTVALGDTDPDDLTFADANDRTPSDVVESSAVLVSGIGSPAPIRIAGGEYQIVGSSPAWTTTTGTVAPGQQVRLRVTTPATAGAAATATLTIGRIAGTFTVRTRAAAAAVAVAPAAAVQPSSVPQPPAPIAATPLSTNSKQNGVPAPQ